MAVGFISMIWITTNAFIQAKIHIPLEFSNSECPNVNATIAETTSAASSMRLSAEEDDL